MYYDPIVKHMWLDTYFMGPHTYVTIIILPMSHTSCPFCPCRTGSHCRTGKSNILWQHTIDPIRSHGLHSSCCPSNALVFLPLSLCLSVFLSHSRSLTFALCLGLCLSVVTCTFVAVLAGQVMLGRVMETGTQHVAGALYNP